MKKKCSCYYKYFPQDIHVPVITKDDIIEKDAIIFVFLKVLFLFFNLCLIVKLDI